MINLYRKIWNILDRWERRRFCQLLVLIMIMGLLDMVGVAAILPFLAVVANPGQVGKSHSLSGLQHWANLPDPGQFQIGRAHV